MNPFPWDSLFQLQKHPPREVLDFALQLQVGVTQKKEKSHVLYRNHLEVIIEVNFKDSLIRFELPGYYL